MKKLLLGLLFLSTFANAQETEFKFTKDGFTDYVIGTVPNKTSAELYKKTIDWVSVTYKNPKEVIMAQIENEYIRIEGAKSNLLCRKILMSVFCEDTKYQIEISFKNDKYKFDIIELQALENPSQDTRGGWYSIDLINTTFVYKANGEIKGQYKTYPEAIETTFNNLNQDLNKFLSSESILSKKSDW